MALINNVPGTDFQNGTKPFGVSWTSFFEQIFNILTAITQSGTTAQRPTKFLWTGRPYFDTTLGKPIWLKSLGPTVWCDATGASV